MPVPWEALIPFGAPLIRRCSQAMLNPDAYSTCYNHVRGHWHPFQRGEARRQ